MRTRVCWHRADLRAPDNAALSAAAEADAVVPLFVFDPDVLAHAAPPRVAYMLDALAELRAWYRDRGSDLLVRRGDPTEEVVGVARDHDAEGVCWNRDYSGLARDRDERVRAACEDADLAVSTHADDLLHEPGSVTTNAGDTYQVYSYFWKKWRDREKAAPHAAPDAAALADVTGDPLPDADALGFDDPTADLLSAGRAAALDRLEAFCDGPVYRYDDRRDDPSAGATSRLSQDLKWGTVGVREVYAATEDAMADAPDDDAAEGVETYRSELAWREFYTHLLADAPDLHRENFVAFENDVDWRNDPDELRAWKRGETGYPLVDAGMRQLRSEAFVHNRVRMVVASFLTKDLLWDWRAGYAHFRDHLVDHHTANDAGGWQWAASTGPDAQPYFRVFNPTTQCERFDPDATYVREHVPELREADVDAVLDWPSLSPAEREAQAPDYPAPIVDHGARREAAIAAFEDARGD